MWPLVRQARYLGRYRQIAQVLAHHGFGYVVEQIGLAQMLSLPRRVFRRPVPHLPGGAERLRMVMTDLGPTFVKLGQILSTRPDLLPPSFIIELNKLQDTVPPFPGDVAVATIEEELGRPIDTMFRSFERVPLAAASLGQVHGAVLLDGRQVVVKVQRPDIQHTLAIDLAILSELAAQAQERTALGQQYDLNELAWEFSATLRAELDYRREGRNADRFRKNFAGSPIIHIPEIFWDYTSARVLTAERLFGAKVNDIAALEGAGIDRKRLARNSAEIILQEIFTDGFFHADPHPGNLFALPGAVVGVVDFGQVVTLDRAMTGNLLLLLIALTREDVHGALRAMERLDMLTPRDITASIQRDMRRFMDRLIDRPLDEISARETGEELLSLTQRHHLRMPAPLALLLKTIIMIEGVGVQIDPQLDVFAIARPYALRALADLNGPEAVARRTLEQMRDLGEVVGTLPRQMRTVLQQLGDGELHLRTSDYELRRVAAAVTLSSLRLALALVLAAFVLGLSILALAFAQGWSGPLPTAFGIIGLVCAIITGLALVVSILWRGRE
ncbi:MAG TPA: AarF/ABC1/UbiB kinase family protein [Roseiflexaceae bacterium]|nr:AarF/ABC1/UbiB kinase family protein [Roseiflexaceae bacterium]